jgi:tetratricopeptide (TPR) repeat protein
MRLNAISANAFYGRGWVYSKETRYDQAIQDFTYALQLNPNLSGALRERGIEIRLQVFAERIVKETFAKLRIEAEKSADTNRR